MVVATTEFTSQSTAIPGLIVFDVTDIGDERGWFQEKFHRQKFVDAGGPSDFNPVQINVAYNKERGVARGLHAEPWDKYISVASGRIFVAYVDLRKGPDFGKVATLEVDKNKAVFIPKGVANSYQTLSEDVYYIYAVNDHWRAESYGSYPAVNMADESLKIDWPTALAGATISERDRNLPMLAEVTPIEL